MVATKWRYCRFSSIFLKAKTNLNIARVEDIIETVSCSENPHVVDQCSPTEMGVGVFPDQGGLPGMLQLLGRLAAHNPGVRLVRPAAQTVAGVVATETGAVESAAGARHLPPSPHSGVVATLGVQTTENV